MTNALITRPTDALGLLALITAVMGAVCALAFGVAVWGGV